jgi:hypothetical protein
MKLSFTTLCRFNRRTEMGMNHKRYSTYLSAALCLAACGTPPKPYVAPSSPDAAKVRFVIQGPGRGQLYRYNESCTETNKLIDTSIVGSAERPRISMLGGGTAIGDVVEYSFPENEQLNVTLIYQLGTIAHCIAGAKMKPAPNEQYEFTFSTRKCQLSVSKLTEKGGVVERVAVPFTPSEGCQ